MITARAVTGQETLFAVYEEEQAEAKEITKKTGETQEATIEVFDSK